MPTDRYSYDEALALVTRALERYQIAETKGEVEDIFRQYGREGVGYRALCRVLFGGVPPEKALRHYQQEAGTQDNVGM